MIRACGDSPRRGAQLVGPELQVSLLGGIATLVQRLPHVGVALGRRLDRAQVPEAFLKDLTLDGQRCNYVGTAGGLFKSQIGSLLLIMITFGIYTPWALVNLKKWTYENVEVGGTQWPIVTDTVAPSSATSRTDVSISAIASGRPKRWWRGESRRLRPCSARPTSIN